MKRIIRKVWGISMVAVLLVTLLASAAPASAGTLTFGADTSVPSITDRILVGTPGSDIVDFAMNGDTAYAVTGTADAKIYKTTNRGASWSALTAPAAVTGAINMIAVAPDDANVIVFLGNIGAIATNLTAYVSTNGGSTFSALGIIQSATGAVAATTCYDLDISALSSGTRYVGVAGEAAAAGAPGLYYFNLGAAAPVWKNAVITGDFTTGLVIGTIDSFRAIKFSPNFPSDQVIVAISADDATINGARLHMASINSGKWDNVAGLGAYPVALTQAGWAVYTIAKASLALDPAYLGGDDTTRIAFVGLTTTAVPGQDGIYRYKDTSLYAMKTATSIYSVAWDGTNLVSGATTSNIVYRSADALASSPTVSSSTSYKRPGIDVAGVNENVIVAFQGTDVFAGTSGSQSSFSVSKDLGKTYNELSLIDTRISVIEDVYSTPDNAKQYLVSRDTYLAGTVVTAAFVLTNLGPVGTPITFGAGSVDVLGGSVLAGGAALAAGTDISGNTYLLAAADSLSVGTTFNITVANSLTPAVLTLTNIAGATITFGLGSVAAGAAGAGTTTRLGGTDIAAGTNLAGLTYVITAAAPVAPNVGATDQLGLGTNVNFPTPGLSVFRKAGGVWVRNFVTALDGGYIARGAPDNNDVLYLAKRTTTTMFYTQDGGEARWFTRASRYAVQDVAVESKDVAYVAITGGSSVSKTTNAAFTWATSVNTEVSGGNIHMIHSVAVDKLIIGSTLGYVAYSTNGGTSWTKITKQIEAGALLVQVDASDIADSAYIYAASSLPATKVVRWQIGVSTSWTDMTAGVAAGFMAYGLILQGGVLYVATSNGAASDVYRTIGPEDDGPGWSIMTSATEAFNKAPTALRVSTASEINTLYFINTIGNDTLWSYTDTLATKVPVLTAPANGTQNPLNPVTGRSTDIGFTWTKPSKNVTAYDIEIYLDAAGSVTIQSNPVASTAETVVAVMGPYQAGLFNVEFSPGKTYYWAVRVSGAGPIESNWSDMRKFTVEPGVAEVPAILAPSNGANAVSTRPSFSWSPVAQATEYQFVLALNPALAAPVIDVKVNTSAYRPLQELQTGTTYYWSVRATAPVVGGYSAVANFMVATPVTTTAAPPVIITQVPAPTIIIPPAPTPPPAQTIIIPPAPTPPAPIAPAYIWAIIIIGAVLVIAVIVLIVRTRRTV